MKFLAPASLAIAFLFCGSASASPLIDATKTCLADSTTGKDRKLLGKWIFLAISSHPEISDLSSATSEDHDATSKAFAALFMRLVTEDCKSEMTAMIAEGGSTSMKTAFEFLGQVAMQEIMSNERVNGSISAFEAFIDNEKLAPVVNPPKSGG